MANTPGVAHGYTRVSTDDQVRSGIGLEVSEDEIRRYFAYKLEPAGYRWGGTCRDEAVSGKKRDFLDRPAGQALHAQLRAGDCVVFPKLDRGFRNARDCLKMLQIWSEMGVGIIFLDVDVDTRTPVGRMMITIMAAFAEWEWERIRERNRYAARYRAQHGMPQGKPRPRIGFKYVGPKGKQRIVPDGHDREVIDRVVEWHIAGSSFDAIMLHLQKLNIKRSNGREWSLQRVKRAYYREVEHLVKQGVLEKVGRGHRNVWVIKWAKVPDERKDRLEELYTSLGRTINDNAGEVCDVNDVKESAPSQQLSIGTGSTTSTTNSAPSAEAAG